MFEQVCSPQIEFLRSNPAWRYARKLALQCKEFFFTYMGNHWKGFHTRELIATNDCFASFKYTHEFVTNYDFDEFILPRKLVPTSNLADISRRYYSSSSSSCSNKSRGITYKYNLYEFVHNLVKKAGENNSKIAWLSFEHVMFFHTLPANFLPNLKQAAEQDNDTSMLVKFEYENSQDGIFEFEPERDARLAWSVLNSSSVIIILFYLYLKVFKYTKK